MSSCFWASINMHKPSWEKTLKCSWTMKMIEVSFPLISSKKSIFLFELLEKKTLLKKLFFSTFPGLFKLLYTTKVYIAWKISTSNPISFLIEIKSADFIQTNIIFVLQRPLKFFIFVILLTVKIYLGGVLRNKCDQASFRINLQKLKRLFCD